MRHKVDKDLYGSGLLGDSLAPQRSGQLSAKFTLPPFTVLNAREKWWQDRKRAWLALGIQSELGRGENLQGLSEQQKQQMANGSAYLDEHGKRQKGYNAAAPGGSAMPAMNYKNRERGSGSGKAIDGTAAAPRPSVQVNQDDLTIAPPNPIRVAVAAPKPRGDATVKKPRQQKAAAPAKKRFNMPTILSSDTAKKDVVAKAMKPLSESSIVIAARALGDALPTFDEATWDEDAGKGAVGVDVESYPNFFTVCLRRYVEGQPDKRIAFELSERSSSPDWRRLIGILERECIVTFNGATYDMPMIFLAAKGKDTGELHRATERIIFGDMKRWDVEREICRVPDRINHIDLMEPNPSIRQGLKVLAGRLHCKVIANLPFEPGAYLSRADMNLVTLYCMDGDLVKTRDLFFAMREPLLLRYDMTKRYGLDMRSKSDAQIGEAIVKQAVEKATGRRIFANRDTDSSDSYSGFAYEVPDFIKFENARLNDLLDKLRGTTRFYINPHTGKVETPPVLADLKIPLGASVYSMGKGGLHSTEGTRALRSDNNNVLIDADVSGQYPAIILKLGKYPRAMGPKFLDVYGEIMTERLEAKRAKDKVKADTGKIALNGVYGKLGSRFSALYSPDMVIGTTLTGQLSVLMLVEMSEREGIPVVSGNTDGVLFFCPRAKEEALTQIIKGWEAVTGFEVEVNRYKSIHNSSVNTYIAVKEDGSVKRKGPIANPRGDGDKRGQLGKNPQMEVCSDAIVKLITDGVPLEDTIRNEKDVRNFVTVINVKDGGVWRSSYKLGKVVRYYWSTDGDAIRYTSSGNKVARTDGARPLMELAEDFSLPDDVDFNRYVEHATELAYDLAVMEKPSVFGEKK